jgi:hypothetical protein
VVREEGITRIVGKQAERAAQLDPSVKPVRGRLAEAARRKRGPARVEWG